ncbi:hypothetical protein QLX08_001360 [Tetragonisca angustula]|uniref:Uncharacterized protein n=1 Tax=Tetragonisca angustula TaxID=166442 RepID=A0AAW1AFQ2_9HYME
MDSMETFPTAREIHLCRPSMIHRYDDPGWRRWTRGCSIVYRSDPWKSEFIGRYQLEPCGSSARYQGSHEWRRVRQDR